VLERVVRVPNRRYKGDAVWTYETMGA